MPCFPLSAQAGTTQHPRGCPGRRRTRQRAKCGAKAGAAHGWQPWSGRSLPGPSGGQAAWAGVGARSCGRRQGLWAQAGTGRGCGCRQGQAGAVGAGRGCGRRQGQAGAMGADRGCGCRQAPANTAPANVAPWPSLWQPGGRASLQHCPPAGHCPPPASTRGHPGEPPASASSPCQRRAQGDPRVISATPLAPASSPLTGSQRHWAEGPGCRAGFGQGNVRGGRAPRAVGCPQH